MATETFSAPPDSGTSDFARLCELFERLASRQSHGQKLETLQDDVQLPADLAPLVRSLAGLVDTRQLQRERKNDVKVNSNANMPMEDADMHYQRLSSKTFPLDEYPFTFRMMLHKLYRMDDWKEKIRQVLKRSQNEYKPLAEKDSEQGGEGGLSGNSALERKEHGTEQGAAEQMCLKETHRPHPKSTIASKPSNRRAEPPKSPQFPLGVTQSCTQNTYTEEMRAVKKRCVGRTKSESCPLGNPKGLAGGNWTYDAAVTAVESTGRRQIPNRLEPAIKLKADASGQPPRMIRSTRRISLATAKPPVGPLDHTLGPGINLRRRCQSVMIKSITHFVFHHSRYHL